MIFLEERFSVLTDVRLDVFGLFLCEFTDWSRSPFDELHTVDFLDEDFSTEEVPDNVSVFHFVVQSGCGGNNVSSGWVPLEVGHELMRALGHGYWSVELFYLFRVVRVVFEKWEIEMTSIFAHKAQIGPNNKKRSFQGSGVIFKARFRVSGPSSGFGNPYQGSRVLNGFTVFSRVLVRVQSYLLGFQSPGVFIGFPGLF